MVAKRGADNSLQPIALHRLFTDPLRHRQPEARVRQPIGGDIDNKTSPVRAPFLLKSGDELLAIEQPQVAPKSGRILRGGARSRGVTGRRRRERHLTLANPDARDGGGCVAALRAQPRAPFCAAGINYRAPGAGAHALAKTMRSFLLHYAGLKGAFHGDGVGLSEWQQSVAGLQPHIKRIFIRSLQPPPASFPCGDNLYFRPHPRHSRSLLSGNLLFRLGLEISA